MSYTHGGGEGEVKPHEGRGGSEDRQWGSWHTGHRRRLTSHGIRWSWTLHFLVWLL